jgi:glycosyltransferase involved in cell wall biosynthesis
MITVIICSHNPKEEYLTRTLDSLKNQSLSKDCWELLLVDNLSSKAISESWSLSWHPAGRHVLEEKLGLTQARLRGIREARGDLLVLVDDDNLLAADYLEVALKISKSHPFLGAWGGSCIAEYEKKPPPWFALYEGNIAVRKIDCVCWSNRYFDYASTPVGAGMCLRRAVAEKYSAKLQYDDDGISLDRKGSSLMSCGDHDMAWTSIELGVGIGVFPELSLTHIIPEERTRLDYVLKLLEADACSSALLRMRITGHIKYLPSKKSFLHIPGIALVLKKFMWRRKSYIRDMARQAKMDGIRRAMNIIKCSQRNLEN